MRGGYFSGRAPSASAVCAEAVGSGPQLPSQSPCWWGTAVRGLRAQLGPRALNDSGSASSRKRTVCFNVIMMCKLICQLGDLTFLTRPFLLMAQGTVGSALWLSGPATWGRKG